jgi:glycosyltransferase involved in cell wall biosynthesis
MEPMISVLMPCYNVGEAIDETIESLLEQTLPAFEIVAVDDGSEDSTSEKLRGWSMKDSRLRVITLPHGGIIPALNTGLAACRSHLVARMDGDDIAHPERLERQVAYLEANPQVTVLGSLVEGFPQGEVREGFQIYLEWLNRLVDHEAITREIFIESPLAHPSVTFRRRSVEAVGGYRDYGWAEDYDLWLRLYLEGARFEKIPEILLYWREHPARLTRIDSRYSVENFLRAKARYLMQGPLRGRDAVIIWGAGQMGRRLSKHLLREGAPLEVFIDIDPKKVGRTRKGLPVVSPEELKEWWVRFSNPVVLAAVGSRGVRALIGEDLSNQGLREGLDWWAVA